MNKTPEANAEQSGESAGRNIWEEVMADVRPFNKFEVEKRADVGPPIIRSAKDYEIFHPKAVKDVEKARAMAEAANQDASAEANMRQAARKMWRNDGNMPDSYYRAKGKEFYYRERANAKAEYAKNEYEKKHDEYEKKDEFNKAMQDHLKPVWAIAPPSPQNLPIPSTPEPTPTPTPEPTPTPTPEPTPTPTPEPTPTPTPDLDPTPIPFQSPSDLPPLPSPNPDRPLQDDSIPEKPMTEEHKNKHVPSRSAKFLENQSIAKERGQRSVGDEKREKISSGDVDRKIAEGEDINTILENASTTDVFMHADEFLEHGASPEKVLDNMSKTAGWLRIDELVSHGYDINKLADKLDNTAIWLQRDKFVKYGADLDRLKKRLSNDKYLKSLIDRGELFGDTKTEN